MAEKEIKLDMDTGLWHRAKVVAAKLGISLKKLCTDAIKKEVEAAERAIEDGYLKQ